MIADDPLESGIHRRSRAHSRASSKPLEIKVPEPALDDTIDHLELVSTPLLPPMMAEHRPLSTEELQSPLQSPRNAERSAPTSIAGSPTRTSMLPSIPTPPLSAKASAASLQPNHFPLALRPSVDIPGMKTSGKPDPWADKLGHANFHITPQPYFPEVCCLPACKRLLDDWESARLDYMQTARRVSEHYGPTSQTYKLTEQKWAEIDAQWRTYHERANAEAEASQKTAMYQPLAETQRLDTIPTLNDPEQPAKFPKVDEADIVGPMVQYTKVPEQKSRKPMLLKLFTDPVSLLGGRSPFGIRR